jgi:thiol-disulfide isomerase/thioredoxin
MNQKKIFLTSLLPIIGLLLTGCSTGGVSSANQNAYISGDGSGFVVPVKERKAAPVLTGKDLDGNLITTKIGEVEVINLWASWCAPCRAEAPLLADFAKKNPNIKFYGILTRDNLLAAKEFEHHYQITYPSFADDSVILQFKGAVIPNAIPSTIVIDEKGRIAARISGEINTALFTGILKLIAGGNVNA